ncbi:4-oxalocrotonate tautomerase family protein [Pendulispora albinea]|uniref:4-oxalocrotonate tautomerase family protein n=1 Tax=Pendulispora albinea TaxID=2741071 RepID=A0ABZ2MA91_9BACT
MPYLQLDVSRRYSVEQKRRLAKRLGAIYARVMQANVRRISIAIRELEAGVWRCTEDEPYPAALLMCDIRSGRPPEQRTRLAEELLAACQEELALTIEEINLEFTQHPGDEMYHPLLGGLSDDWREGEA